MNIRNIFTDFRRILKPPAFIYQMGKVGSSSLLRTLSEKYHGPVFHAHTYKTLTRTQKAILKIRQSLGLPIYIICPVRDPISRNLAAFFHNFTRDTGHKLTDKDWSIAELVDLFIEHYPHNASLEWFDKSMRTTFNFDVFSSPFPVEKKWKIYKFDSMRLLVYRTDLGRDEQLEVISDFLGVNISEWSYWLVGTTSLYAKKYKDFTQSARLPDPYISSLAESKYFSHFWSRQEIDEIAEKWKAGP